MNPQRSAEHSSIRRRKTETISLTALRLLPFSLLIRTIASIGMLADLFASMIANSGTLIESRIINPDFEVMVLIALIGYIIGIYCLSGLTAISPKIRTSLNALTAVTVIACGELALSSWGLFVTHAGLIGNPAIVKTIIDISFFALVIVEMVAVKLLLYGFADYLGKIGKDMDASRGRKLGAGCLYVNAALMAITMAAALIKPEVIGYLLMIVCPVWIFMFLTASIVVYKNSYDIWRFNASGART